MTPRDLVRDQTYSRLKQSGLVPDGQVFTPRTWPLTGALYPCIVVRTPSDRKSPVSGNSGYPQFLTSVSLVIETMTTATTDGLADDKLRQIVSEIEDRVFADGDYHEAIRLQQFGDVETEFSFNAQTDLVLGLCRQTIEVEIFETFETRFYPLYQPADIDTIAIRVAEPAGTTVPGIDATVGLI